MPADAAGFDTFLQRHAKDFPRIARASRGEWEAGDVRSQAWLLAHDIGLKRGHPLDLDDGDDASLLIRYLYNHCVKYDETVVRHATRLDHGASDGDDNPHHWLLDTLVSDDGEHPLSLLELFESAEREPPDPDPYHSVAASWLHLLQRFDQRMTDVAAFLLISLSWCYTRCRAARQLADTQWPLPHTPTAADDALQPWRKFKLPARQRNEPLQLAMDYWNKPMQPERGQLWLL